MKIPCHPVFAWCRLSMVCNCFWPFRMHRSRGLVYPIQHQLSTSSYFTINKVFFEFNSVADAGKSQPATLLTEEVKVGELYEIVMAINLQWALPLSYWRHHNKSIGRRIWPEMYLPSDCRKIHMLNIFREKVYINRLSTSFSHYRGYWTGRTLESILHSRLHDDSRYQVSSSSVSTVDWTLSEYTGYRSGSDINIQAILSEGAAYVDKKLAEINKSYAFCRGVRNKIGPLSVSEVNMGTFETVISTLKKRSLGNEIRSKCLALQLTHSSLKFCKMLK